MANHGKAASKHEYNKPRLKEQIDDAMAAFLRSGKAVERIPTVLVPEPLPPAAKEDGEEGDAADDLDEAEETSATSELGPPEALEAPDAADPFKE